MAELITGSDFAGVVAMLAYTSDVSKQSMYIAALEKTALLSNNTQLGSIPEYATTHDLGLWGVTHGMCLIMAQQDCMCFQD